jgi:hypothetical protein
MIKLPRIESLMGQMAMGQNIQLNAGNPADSGTYTPALFPKVCLPMYERMVGAPPQASTLPFGVVPMQDHENKFAVGDMNEPKVSNPAKMSMNALKPVGAGATIFNPFNLQSYR